MCICMSVCESFSEEASSTCTCVVVDLVPHLQLLGDWIKEIAGTVSNVLVHGRRVVVYSGNDNFICNYFGGGRMDQRHPVSQAVSHVDHALHMHVHVYTLYVYSKCAMCSSLRVI